MAAAGAKAVAGVDDASAAGAEALLGLGGTAAGTEAAGIVASAARTIPAAIDWCCWCWLGIGGVGGSNEAAGVLTGHAVAHEALHSAGSIGAGGFYASGGGALDVALANMGVAEHGALIAEIDQLLGGFIVGDALDAYGLDL